jgi:Activator of Hsp90 ATPase homolog 1-like protein
VCFEAQGSDTEVVITHERIPNESARTSHETGWNGCLDSLVRYAEQSG